MKGEIIVTKEAIDAVKLVYDVEDNYEGSITYIPTYATCKTTLTVGKPYEFEVDFNTQSYYGEVLISKDFNQMALFLNFVEGVFATLEVLKNESI